MSSKSKYMPKVWDMVMDDPDLSESITTDMAYVMRGKGVPVKRTKGVDFSTRGVFMHIQGTEGTGMLKKFEASRRRKTMRVFEDGGHTASFLQLSEERRKAEENLAKTAQSASMFTRIG